MVENNRDAWTGSVFHPTQDRLAAVSCSSRLKNLANANLSQKISCWFQVFFPHQHLCNLQPKSPCRFLALPGLKLVPLGPSVEPVTMVQREQLVRIYLLREPWMVQSRFTNLSICFLVAIRMRPLNDNEEAKKRVWHVMPENNAVHQTKKDGTLLDRIAGRTYFNYDRTFGEEVQTVEVYNDIAKPIVTSVVNGLNGTIFAYGQTSSGKTYTMQGSGSIEDGSHSDGGIVHMAVRDIFSHIESQKDRMFLVRASFLEIYNEDVRDLLSHSTESLQIREDPRHGVFVQSVEETVTDFESLLKILFYGEKSRQVASTGMNERSSRSHTIFRITIESRKNVQGNEGTEKENDDNDSAVLVSTLNLVDLAGSESVRHTGASGDRQKEGGMINQR